MRVHSDIKIRKLKQLRKTGHSIHEIMNKLGMRKTTVWHHIQGVEVLPKYKEILRSKRGGGKARKERNTMLAVDKAKKIFKDSNKELIIAFTMLYWAEGSKGTPEFINSDGRMITLYLQILRDVLFIPNESIQVTIRIFTGMNEKECVKYWSSITKMPRKNFIIRMNDGGTRSRTRYGLCRIGVKKGGHFLKLMHALIDETYGYMIK